MTAGITFTPAFCDHGQGTIAFPAATTGQHNGIIELSSSEPELLYRGSHVKGHCHNVHIHWTYVFFCWFWGVNFRLQSRQYLILRVPIDLVYLNPLFFVLVEPHPA
ncbi:hypothetical protein ACFL6U_31110 [Planctomycetota bacterium]